MSTDHAARPIALDDEPLRRLAQAQPRFVSWLGKLAVIVVLIFLILPTAIIIPMSVNASSHLGFPPEDLTLAWYRAYFLDPDWMAATLFSLKIAAGTSLAATFIGTLTALAVVRGDLPLKATVRAIALGPMIVPHVVLGVALYLVFAPLALTGSIWGFLIGHTVLAVPFVVITVTASLQRMDPALEMAAASCGATPLRCFFHVTLPDIAPGVAAGGVFAFIASFDEATVGFFISDIGGKSIGRKMFEDIDFNLTPIIAAASTVVVVASLCLIGIAHLISPSSPTRT